MTRAPATGRLIIFFITWKFWSIVFFFAPLLAVAYLSGRKAFDKGHREAYYLLAFCLGLCAAVYANAVLHIKMTGTLGLEKDKEVQAAKEETFQARDEVLQMKIEVGQSQAAMAKVEKQLRELSETTYVADKIILHGMDYPLPHVFRAAAYRELKKMDGALGNSVQLNDKIEAIIKKADKENERVWAKYNSIPDDKMKAKFLDDYIRKSQE